MLRAGSVATALPDGSFAGEVELGADADAVSLQFVNANGQIVHTQEMGAHVAGPVGFAWDGKDPDGNAVAGPLRVTARAHSGQSMVDTTLRSWTGIAGIQSPSAGAQAQLVTGLGMFSPDSALRLI